MMLLSFALACNSSTDASRGAPLTFSKLTLGLQHTCGITTEGDAYCWGTDGMLGDGTVMQRDRPSKVVGGRRYFDISTGSGETCALATDSTTYCWGVGGPGNNGLEPVLVSSIKFQAISLGAYGLNKCAMTSEGDVYCWGTNVYGQVGDGTLSPVAAPKRVSTPRAARAISTLGGAHACLLAETGEAYCWGYNGQGQLGIADTAYTCSPVLACAFPNSMVVKGGLTFTSVSTGGGSTCGLTPSHAAYCWGSDLGGNSAADTCIPIIPCNPSPKLVAGSRSYASITSGIDVTCAITIESDAYCWGSNEEAQLGNGVSGGKQPLASQVVGGIKFRELYPGIRHTCGIALDGRAYCWGNNISGELGIGSFDGLFPTPQAVVGP